MKTFIIHNGEYLSEGDNMRIADQIRVLCVRTNISMAELARRIGISPQSLSAKMKRESFTIADLETIAEAVGAEFERKFVLHNGEKI
jgi:transcriptional regulator with XRE-family HTH domain